MQRHSIRNYAWDNPSSQEKILVIHINGREREIDVAEIGQVFQIKYPVNNLFDVKMILISPILYPD